MDRNETLKLADEILEFLERHARTAADFDPAYDDPSERFSGPDPVTLSLAAAAIREGSVPPPVQSSWGSGCYSPYGDREAQAWHDRLCAAVADLRTSSAPLFGR